MVFADESERHRRGARAGRPATVDQSVSFGATPDAVPKRAPIERPAPRVASASVSSLGCIGGLVRLALFVFVVWYVGKWLVSIPEVAMLIAAFRSGSFSDSQVTAAIDAVRTHVLQLFGVSPAAPNR